MAFAKRPNRVLASDRRGRSGIPGITATVDGQAVAVSRAGPQPDFEGLEVNLRLPRSLAGSGQCEIAIGIDGWGREQSNDQYSLSGTEISKALPTASRQHHTSRLTSGDHFARAHHLKH